MTAREWLVCYVSVGDQGGGSDQKPHAEKIRTAWIQRKGFDAFALELTRESTCEEDVGSLGLGVGCPRVVLGTVLESDG